MAVRDQAGTNHVTAEVIPEDEGRSSLVQKFRQQGALRPSGPRLPELPPKEEGEVRRLGIFRTSSSAQREHQTRLGEIRRAGEIGIFTADVATVVEVQTLATAATGVALQERFLYSLPAGSLAEEFATAGLIQSAHRQMETLNAISERFRKKAIS